MAVVRDAELLYIVVRRDRGSRSQKYRTQPRNLTENRVVSIFLVCPFFPSHDPCLDVFGTAFGGFGLTSVVGPNHIRMFGPYIHATMQLSIGLSTAPSHSYSL